MKFFILGSFTAFLLAFHFHIYFIHSFYLDNSPNDELLLEDSVGSIPYTCNHHSSCGDIVNITYPFRLEGDPKSCGNPKYELSCINNQTILKTILNLKEGNFEEGDFAVKSINYHSATIRVSYLGVRDGNYCSSIPRYYVITDSSTNRERIAYLSCEKPVNSPFYVNTSDCIEENEAFGRRYGYVVVDKSLHLSELAPSCAVDLVTTMALLEDTKKNFTYVDIHKQLVYGLELSFEYQMCDLCIGERVWGICKLVHNTIHFTCFRNQIAPLYSSDILPYTCNQHSSCGEIVDISYPFRLKGDPKNCGEPKYELSCINNQTILNLEEGNFAVKVINYMDSSIRVSDLGVQEINYSSIPRYSLSWNNSMYSSVDNGPYEPYIVQQGYLPRDSKYVQRLAYISCKIRMEYDLYYLKLNTSDCISALGMGRYCYVVVDRLDFWELFFHSCVVDLVTTTATLLRDSMKNFTYVDIHKDLVYGFELGFYRVQCEACNGFYPGRDAWPDCYCNLGNNNLHRNYRVIEYCGFYVVDAYIRHHFQSVLFLLPMAPYFTPQQGRRQAGASWVR